MKSILLYLLVASVPIPLFGAVAEPPELAYLNKLYEEATRAAQDPIDAKYLEKLNTLLEDFTKDGRTADALVVKKTIEAAIAKQAASRPTPPAEPLAPPPPGTISLKGESSVLEGALKLKDGLIENWVRTNCLATWHTRDVPDGKYNVFFVYDAASDMGGAVEVSDLSYRFAVDITPTSEEDSLELEKATGSQPKASSRPAKPKLVPRKDRVFVFDRIMVGTIETRGGIGMKVGAKSVSEAGIMNLKEIQLVPVK